MAKEKTNLVDLNVLLGVSGGISAYKAVDLASRLVTAGVKVKTVMTDSACQLVAPKSFEAITCSQVYTSLWNKEVEYGVSHVDLVDWADVVVVAPATANIIGKVANGICDDLLSTMLCVCWKKPAFLAPAMNSNMWDNPAVQRNVKAVKKMGFELIEPEHGRLACGTVGTGRMAEPATIVEQIKRIASRIKKNKG